MKSTKWRKWKLSKYKFPTFEVHGMNGPGTGSLSIGWILEARKQRRGRTRGIAVPGALRF